VAYITRGSAVADRPCVSGTLHWRLSKLMPFMKNIKCTVFETFAVEKYRDIETPGYAIK